MKKIEALQPLERDLLLYLAINNHCTTTGIGLSCFDRELPLIHPKKVRESLSQLIKYGYLQSPEKNDFLCPTSSVFFTEDGFHESQIAFSVEIKEKLNKENKSNDISKIFISHASEDAKIVEEVIELLEGIGINSEQIFCTSFEDYGIRIGDDFLDSIKAELVSNSLVIFILSRSFYKSPVCLCEMGATWVLAKEHIPMLVPPFDYPDLKGVIPLTQGMKINEPLKLNSLKTKIEELFAIEKPITLSVWERKRDRILSRIENLINHSTIK
jgi:hypothetical protein